MIDYLLLRPSVLDFTKVEPAKIDGLSNGLEFTGAASGSPAREQIIHQRHANVPFVRGGRVRCDDLLLLNKISIPSQVKFRG